MEFELKRYISHQAYGGYPYENTEVKVSGESYQEVKKALDQIVKDIKKSIVPERNNDKELVQPF